MYCPHSKILIKRLLHFWGLASLQLGQVESTEMNRDKVHKMWWKTQHPKELVVLQCRLCITECKTWCRVRWSREKRICRRGRGGKPSVGQSSVQWKTPRSKFGSRQALKPIGRVSKSRVRECLLAFSRLLWAARACAHCVPSTCALSYYCLPSTFFLLSFAFSFLAFYLLLSFLTLIWETVLKTKYLAQCKDWSRLDGGPRTQDHMYKTR